MSWEWVALILGLFAEFLVLVGIIVWSGIEMPKTSEKGTLFKVPEKPEVTARRKLEPYDGDDDGRST